MSRVPILCLLASHFKLFIFGRQVSAEGVASEWGVWPLVGLRVPHNATLDPVLTLYNPTDKHIQVLLLFLTNVVTLARVLHSFTHRWLRLDPRCARYTRRDRGWDCGCRAEGARPRARPGACRRTRRARSCASRCACRTRTRRTRTSRTRPARSPRTSGNRRGAERERQECRCVSRIYWLV